jgi:cell division protein FtsI (penicillin-binding protein 3)
MTLLETMNSIFVQAQARRALRSARFSDAAPPTPRNRLIVLLALFVVMSAVVAYKVVNLQVLERERYTAYGESQRTRTQTLSADRGSILDRNGTELAISRPSRSVFVDPELIIDAAAEAAVVAPILGLEVADVQARMSMSNRFAYIARKVPVEVADQLAAKVDELGLEGVAFLDEKERYFPAGLSARSLLGGVDVDNTGISGLESQYGDVLTGTPGSLSLEKDRSGGTIAVGEHRLTPAVRGNDLRLTLDRSIQFEAERLLADQVRATKAKGGVAIVTVPGTGEILAIANIVTDPTSGEPVVSSNNLAVTTQYEPGSVMKMVTIAGAIERGQISPSTVFNLPPTLKVHDAEFGEAEGRGTVDWSVTDILTNSSNVGTIKIAQGLGKDSLHSMQRSFGFGARTSLMFPNEANGAVLDPARYSGTSLPSIAIGQGIAVTPLQMLLAYNTIANRGVYVPPRLIQSTVEPNGTEHPTEVGSTHRVVSAGTADSLNLMLRNVVADGTGRLAAIDGYLAAGKTGTARKPQPGGGYLDRFGIARYQSTFVGFVPAEQPALSVYVMIDEPTAGDYTGGATAAPVFSKLGSFALRRLGIAPAATDLARGGAPVDAASEARTAMATATVVGDRVRALTAGSAPAAPAVPLIAGASVPSTTILPRSGSPR